MISIGVKCSEVDVEKRGRWEAGAFYQVVGKLELGPISKAGLNQSIGAYRDRRKSKDERIGSCIVVQQPVTQLPRAPYPLLLLHLPHDVTHEAPRSGVRVITLHRGETPACFCIRASSGGVFYTHSGKNHAFLSSSKPFRLFLWLDAAHV